MRKLRFKIYLLLAAIIITVLSGSAGSAYAAETVFIGGFPAGFIINSQGAEVVGICEVYSEQGILSPSRAAGLKVGDLVTGLNGSKVNAASDIEKALRGFKGDTTNIEIYRDGEVFNLTITPLKDSGSGKYKIGLFVRDSMTGIGTVTYVKKDSLRFGALGHPVLNQQGELVPIEKSEVYLCSIVGVNKGQKGTPGELRGIIIKDKVIGTADKNTQSGLYGTINKNGAPLLKDALVMPVSSAAKPGKASVFTTISGTEAKEYSVSIVKVEKNDKQNKNLVIKITDNALLNTTGGIVQGMSGSPIVQDGKLVGAITHVFVNDPTRGFGILIENMI